MSAYNYLMDEEVFESIKEKVGFNHKYQVTILILMTGIWVTCNLMSIYYLFSREDRH